MSRLFWTEAGHVVPTLCEELSSHRRARKVLHLPETSERADLYLLARARSDSRRPLRVRINGFDVAPISPSAAGGYCWYQVGIEPECLREGENHFEFWSDGSAMDSWALGLEAGHHEPQSWVSDDGGISWRDQKMGYLNIVRGEYVIRLRLAEGQDPSPPSQVWEDPANPRLDSLRQIMPRAALDRTSLLEQVRALTGWLSASWEHTGSSIGLVYAPWDAETILAWGRSQTGHDGRRPIVMCVHYAVAFVSCCQACGIPARCSVLWDGLNGVSGHFVAEVWFPEHQKWVMVDPNLDSVFWQDGVPMSVSEIQEKADGLAGLVEWGPGYAAQRQNPRIGPWVEEVYLSGRCFTHRSVWYRADFLSHPEFSPPGHGSTSYCETGLVWEERDLARGLGMFPYFGATEYFDAPPRLCIGEPTCTHPAI